MNNSSGFDSPTRWGINFLAILGVVVALKFGREVFLPVVISLLLAVVLWPAVNFFNYKWKMPRPIAGLAALTVLIALSSLLIFWAVISVQTMFHDLASGPSQVQRPPPVLKNSEEGHAPAASLTTHVLASLGDGQSSLVAVCTMDAVVEAHQLESERRYQLRASDPYIAAYDRIRVQVAKVSPDFAEQLFPKKHEQSVFFKSMKEFVETETRNVPMYLQVAVEQTLLILFLVLFIVIEGDMLIRRTADIFGPSTVHSDAATLALNDMARHIRSYIVWRSVINLGMTIVLGIFYTQLGLRQPWTWAILAGVLTFIPYLGPIIAGIPALIDAFVTVDPTAALWIVAVYMVILTLEGYVVFPLVIGRHMEMNATTVMLACVFWYFVWGHIGLFLALPLMAGIRAIFQHVPNWRPWANLMAMEIEDEHKPANGGPPPPTSESNKPIELQLFERHMEERDNPGGGDTPNPTPQR